MPKCKCCQEEISEHQDRFSGLCPLCDIGRCRSPVDFHKLRNNYLDLLKKFGSLSKTQANPGDLSANKDFTAHSDSPKICPQEGCFGTMDYKKGDVQWYYECRRCGRYIADKPS